MVTRHAPSGSARRTGLAALLALALTAIPVAPGTPYGTAQAITPQSEQVQEIGVIRRVVDGDTVHVDVTWSADPTFIAPPASADPLVPSARSYCGERLNPDGSMPGGDGDIDDCRIRLIAIQTPEKAGASGGSALEQCRASAATQALAAVLPVGTRVQLRSISSRSVEDDYSGGRLARTVYYQDSSGAWVDAGRAVLSGGHAMWFPFNVRDSEKPEYVHNLEYRRLVDAAAAARRGMFGDGYCGPSAPARVRTWVVSDPIGSDAGAEHVVVVNDSEAPLDVSGWTVRDSSLTWAVLPAGTVIGPHDHIRIFPGSGVPGTPTPRDFYFGGSRQMFANWDPAAGYFYGDSVAVHDAQAGYAYGNLRAWFQYPCDPAGCTDPLTGKVRIGTVSYNPPGKDTAAGEYVDLVNVSGAPVALGGYAFTRKGAQFPLPPGAVLAPGATLRVAIGTGIDDATTVHMGRTASLLANSGDRVTLSNLDHAVVDCRAWGSYSCAGVPVSGSLQTPAPPPAATPASAKRKATKPGAPQAVTVQPSKRRLVAAWSVPADDGGKRLKKYRAKVYRLVSGRWKYRTKCYSKAKKMTCRTKKLSKKPTTYKVVVQARNKKGYGAKATSATITNP